MDKVTLIDTAALPAVPWKNGGGVTREVAQAAGPNGFVWRLSLADVDTEGAFSAFPGMSRILTVIEGRGLELHSPDEAFVVPFGEPFHFSGETQISSVLPNGRIRDFNVIFDSALIAADVSVLRGPVQRPLNPDGAVIAVLGVIGDFVCDGAAASQGAVALIGNCIVSLDVPGGSTVLLVCLVTRTAA